MPAASAQSKSPTPASTDIFSPNINKKRTGDPKTVCPQDFKGKRSASP